MTDVQPTNTPYELLKNALVMDPGYLWSWQSNLAMNLVDNLGLDRKIANKAAAAQIKHMFGIDVTVMQEYIDIVSEPEPTKEIDKVDENAIYITVTGFKANSGAEALAKRIKFTLEGGGYHPHIRIADTILSLDERATALPERDIYISITGVESRWHTDASGPIEMPESLTTIQKTLDALRDEQLQEAHDLELLEAEPDIGGYEDEGEEGYELGIAECGCCGRESESKLTMRLTLDDLDPDPLVTVDFIRSQYPAAALEVTGKLSYETTQAYHKLHRQSKDTYQPGEETVEPTGIVLQEKQVTLANPEDRKYAFLMERLVDGEVRYSLQFMNYNHPDFSYEAYLNDPWRIAPIDDYVKFSNALHEFTDDAGIIMHGPDIHANGNVFRHVYGDKELTEHSGIQAPIEELDFLKLDQKDIPNALYPIIEGCWTAFNDPVKAKYLASVLPAVEGHDYPIAIPLEEYNEITMYGTIVRHHPNINKLFVRNLRFIAEGCPEIRDWCVKQGIV